MKVVQITIDNSLLKQVDSQCGGRNRSAFFRKAAELLLQQFKVKQLEQKDVQGYKRHPVRNEEFDVWHAEQVWPD